MGRRSFLDKDLLDPDADFRLKRNSYFGKDSDSPGRVFAPLKFILGILLFPFVYGVTVSFLEEFGHLSLLLQRHFGLGAITFLVVYLFIWEPVALYNHGYKLVSVGFNFVKPLVKFAPHLLPIFSIILVILYKILSFTIKASWLMELFMFLLGWTILMHLVFSARAVRSKKGDFLGANYIFSFSFIYLVNIVLFGFCLNIASWDFSFADFAGRALEAAQGVFGSVLKQLFF